MTASQIRTICTPLLVASLLYFSARGTHADANYPIPERGAFANAVYTNRYFGLRYTVPAGMREDVPGPTPSVSAYYSLAAFISSSEASTGSLLIAAQDDFFSPETSATPIEFMRQMREHLDPSLQVPEPPSTEQIAGQTFARLNYNGAGLYHTIFAVEVRCHTLIFSFTSANPQWMRSATDSLGALTLMPARDPVCIRDYATADTVLHRVPPQTAGPRYASVPVRLVIDPTGTVEHVHAIAGFPEQMQSVSAAVAQWRFKPYRLHGKAVAVETGVLFQFKAGSNSE